jgi:hypothetical protein
MEEIGGNTEDVNSRLSKKLPDAPGAGFLP